jgi:mono/diheme cytochrome c family protein
MNRAFAVSSLVLAAAVALTSAARPSKQSAAAPQSNAATIARGKYLVEEVARCTECHTPHNSDGTLDRAHWLAGSPIWIRPTQPISGWADRAPALAGFPGYTDAQATAVLEKGQGLEGEPLRPPMHTYHLHHDDAMAIVVYLRSLPPTVSQ